MATYPNILALKNPTDTATWYNQCFFSSVFKQAHILLLKMGKMLTLTLLTFQWSLLLYLVIACLWISQPLLPLPNILRFLFVYLDSSREGDSPHPATSRDGGGTWPEPKLKPWSICCYPSCTTGNFEKLSPLPYF